MVSTIPLRNPLNPRTQPSVAHVISQLKARTVGDIVAADPARVNDRWCRQTLNQLLRLLELQYSIGMPHGPIDADTVVVTDEGETLLLSSWAGGNPEIADDIDALGRLIHYAITHERLPLRPLRGRRLKGYSKSLVGTVDCCMAPVNKGRPQSFAEVRNLVETVDAHQAPVPPGLLAPVRAAAVSIAAIALTLVALAHFHRATVAPDTAASSPLNTPLPTGLPHGAVESALEPIHPLTQPASNRRAADIDVADARADKRRSSSPSQGEAGGARASVAPLTKRSQPSAKPASVPQRAALATVAPSASTPAESTLAAAAVVELNLLIRPWGMVYVDGIAHGASPPIKHIAVTPGPHSILVTNPHAAERRLVVDAGKNTGGLTVSIDFNREP